MIATATRKPWSRLKSQLRKIWSELTDADLEEIAKDRERLVPVVQKRYPAERSTTFERHEPSDRGPGNTQTH
jgi:hypothetical protein